MKTEQIKDEDDIAVLKAILERIKFTDSKSRLFVKESIKNLQKRRIQNEGTNEVVRRLKIQNNKLLVQVALLKDKLKQVKADRSVLQQERGALYKLNVSLAAALGSCELCWGEDPECEECKGLGLPGWRNINRRMFNLYVLPVLEKLYESEN